MHAEQISIEFKKRFQAAHTIFGRPTFIVSRLKNQKRKLVNIDKNKTNFNEKNVKSQGHFLTVLPISAIDT